MLGLALVYLIYLLFMKGLRCVTWPPRYTSDYAHQAGVVKTMTPTPDADGVWRVTGYFVK